MYLPEVHTLCQEGLRLQGSIMIRIGILGAPGAIISRIGLEQVEIQPGTL